ncbi:transketolase [Mycolicibacterium wolinskyi]|uniref:Transketolase n=1 Tax=Mycolicibacterium wolinskyi TaxID=59750 RepID=A0A1X2FH76_9MYCO|nr:MULTISPECIES: transketolase [Mycolicibacterium]MCV7284675.1 transketolase [Mycolicibacterium wolinskyi]MCV7295237.1 transketolase [Mycolicibacterium goodii]ORX17795.1 transketolase [Mycolicibacterium wolinskyi]
MLPETLTPPDAELVERIRNRARFARLETVRLISIAKTGHYASGFSCAEILATLYYGVMRLRRGEPDWPQRDRFLFGKGHAAATLYPLLADWDFFPAAELDEYTRLGNAFGDHPDMTRIPGIDFSSGSLGHALSTGTGIALGTRMQKLPSNVYVLLGDGELHEGQIWEAALAAAHHKVSNLIAIVDRNEHSLDGHIDGVTGIEPLADKWRAFGWEVHDVDGHDVPELLNLLRTVSNDPVRTQPVVVIAHTVKGKGISYMESEFGWHLGWLAEQDELNAIQELSEDSRNNL